MATRHMGLIVTGCLIGGLVAALALVVGPVAGAQEHVITGTVPAHVLGKIVNEQQPSPRSLHA